MLGETIKRLRKKMGYSQETLAQQLNVVRQTVSKWEKGISVPDADMLTRMGELFEVTVEELLGAEVQEKADTVERNEIAAQLAILNEQLANQNRAPPESDQENCARCFYPPCCSDCAVSCGVYRISVLSFSRCAYDNGSILHIGRGGICLWDQL